MPANSFFSQTHCDRCKMELAHLTRKMSWFTDETLCASCANDEMSFRRNLRASGVDVDSLEGCGYMPTPKGEKP